MSAADENVLTPTLIKAARALLGFDQSDLAEKVGISRKTIALIEASDRVNSDPRRLMILKKLQEKMDVELGVEFVFASEKTGEGVRLRRKR